MVSIDRPEPYIWRDPENHEVFLYVDTSDQFDRPEAKQAKVRLGHSKVFVQQSAFESREYDLSQIKSFYVDKSRVLGWMWMAVPWIGIGLFVFGFIGSLIWHLIQLLIYGVIGLIFAAMMGARLDYPALMRLAAVAITPAILLDTALDMAGASFPFSVFLFLVIELAYLAFAVSANRDSAGMPMQMGGYPPAPLPPPPLPPPPSFG